MNTGATISKELIRGIFANPYDGWVSLEDFGDHVLEAFSGIRLIGEIERPEGRETYEELKACLGQPYDLDLCKGMVCRRFAISQAHTAFSSIALIATNLRMSMCVASGCFGKFWLIPVSMSTNHGFSSRD